MLLFRVGSLRRIVNVHRDRLVRGVIQIVISVYRDRHDGKNHVHLLQRTRPSTIPNSCMSMQQSVLSTNRRMKNNG